MLRKQALRFTSAILAATGALLLMGGSTWAQVTYKTLHNFPRNQASFVHWMLVFDTTGNLYGTSCYGGPYGYGVVFKLAPNGDGTWTESTLHAFTGGDDGGCPQGALIFDAAGNLYASAYSGGAYGAGNVFELMPNGDGTWTENVLYTFTGGADGSGPNPMIFDAQGTLYGTVTWAGTGGSGGVFTVTPGQGGTWTYNEIYGFTGGSDGGHPVTCLTFDAAGNLYGMTQWSGAYGGGVVFQLTPNADGTWNENVLHAFSGGTDGSDGGEGLVFDSAGDLYGGTWYGGRFGNGVVFRLTPKTGGPWQESILHEFTGGKDGGDLGEAELIIDAAGNLYGTTTGGGLYGYGVVFKFWQASGAKFVVLGAFNDKPGAEPAGGLIFDAAGNLYGTTGGDGVKTFGTVFEITQ